MKLVIVESPSKAKTINKYLGGDYKVIASYGHVRDLPSKDGSVKPDDKFAMTWALDARGEKQMKEIAAAVKAADAIYLATDPDREGEAISWHVYEILKDKKIIQNKEVKRVVFYEITKNAVKEAMKAPRDLDEGLINAYLARRALDYLVGFTLSPILWRKLPGSKSAGRVQSVALRLITDREAEIEAFVTQEYWSLIGQFLSVRNAPFEGRLTHLEGKKLDKFDLNNETIAHRARDLAVGQTYIISDVEKKQTKRTPSPPFTTSTLQQEAARKLRFSSKKTMQIAQKLYEGISLGGETVGLITYMRTDSTNLSGEAIQGARDFIQKDFGDKYLPENARVFKSKSKNAQEAHEAIRPTDVNRRPEDLKNHLEDDQYKLYELIWKRTVACQMAQALIDQVGVDIESGDKKLTFRATGSTVAFDGFLKLYEEGKDEEGDEKSNRLPELNANEAATLDKAEANQHFTQPPPRYTEASLVKKMEELGIGRPSTYASIMSTLVDRKYVVIEKRQMIPEALGRLVTTFLQNYFPTYVQYDFTANLEDQLDEIAQAHMDWQKVLTDFWVKFKAAIDSAGGLKISDVIEQLNQDLERFLFAQNKDRTCPTCKEGKVSLKLGKYGAFIGCSRYPECNYTHRLSGTPADGDLVETPETPRNEPKVIGNDPQTNEEITLRSGPYGPYLQWGANTKSDDPKAKAVKPKRAAIPKGIDPATITLDSALTLGALPKSLGKHPETKEEMVVGIGRFGPYVRHAGKFTSIPKNMDFLKISADEAVDLIAKKAK